MCRCVDVCVCIWIIHRVSMSFVWYAMGVCSRESLYIAGSSLTVVPVALCVPGNGCVVTVGAVVCVGHRVVQPSRIYSDIVAVYKHTMLSSLSLSPPSPSLPPPPLCMQDNGGMHPGYQQPTVDDFVSDDAQFV